MRRHPTVYPPLPQDPTVYLPLPQDPTVYLLLPQDPTVYLLLPQDPTVRLLLPQHRHLGRSPSTRMATFPQQPIPIIKPNYLRDTSI